MSDIPMQRGQQWLKTLLELTGIPAEIQGHLETAQSQDGDSPEPYMVIGNIFQTAQTYLLSREPLPEELQKIVETQEKQAAVTEQKALPFEPKSPKKKATGGS